MSIGMNIFTSFFVLFLLLSKNVPSSTDKIPLIGAYCCLNMLMIAISTCACTIVVHIFFRGEGQVPYIIRVIFLEFLARVLFMFIPPVLPPINYRSKYIRNQLTNKLFVQSYDMNGNVSNSIHKTNFESKINSYTYGTQESSLNEFKQFSKVKNQKYFSSQQNLEDKRFQFENFIWKNKGFSTQMNELNDNISNFHNQNLQIPKPVYSRNNLNNLNYEIGMSFSLLEKDIKEIRDFLRHSEKKTQIANSKNEHANEWKQVALVLDRTLFFLYIIAIIVSIFVMFPI